MNFSSHRRRSIRVPGFDYTCPGPYYITIVTHDRVNLFGEIASGEMRLNHLGHIMQYEWLRLPERFPGLWLAEFVVMPNHLHGLLMLGAQQAGRADDRKGPFPGSLGTVVRAYKSSTTLRFHHLYGEDAGPLWQRNYFEHIVRGQHDGDLIREYILNNPVQWELDQLYE